MFPLNLIEKKPIEQSNQLMRGSFLERLSSLDFTF